MIWLAPHSAIRWRKFSGVKIIESKYSFFKYSDAFF